MAKSSSFPIHIDKWDSNFFKAPVVRLLISGKKKYPDLYASMKDFLKRAKEEKARFIFIRLEDPMPSREKILARAGFKDCGKYVNLVFRHRTPLKIDPVVGYDLRPFENRDLKKICAIASDAFRFSYLYTSRFVADSIINRYHEIWLKNQTRNKDYLIFVVEKDGEVAGFVTINLKNSKDSARMSLMAVDKKHRGMGLGEFLIKSMQLEGCRRKRIRITGLRPTTGSQFPYIKRWAARS
jgi:GNAT superfamily N-acetyltransferase